MWYFHMALPTILPLQQYKNYRKIPVVFRITPSGEGGIWTLAPLLTTYSLSRGAPSASLGTSPKRRGWDSNPRALSDKRFSRPPRYDHFDTSPYTLFISSAQRTICILTEPHVLVNIFLIFFFFFKCPKTVALFWSLPWDFVSGSRKDFGNF